MRKYLHIPVIDTDTIVKFINDKQSEGEHLDFKAQPWKDNLELCKDVAAFANHLGGDIIIGVEDKGDCANGWCPIEEKNVLEQIRNIPQKLINYLRPSTFSQFIEYRLIPSTNFGEAALVISIPPSVDLIAVEDNKSDFLSYRFPIRNGKRTQYLAYEEVMMRTAISARAAYIKLKELASIGDKVRFSNQVLLEHKGNVHSLFAPHGYYGTLDSYNRDVLVLSMERNLFSDYPYERPIIVESDRKFTIPLELVKAVWRDNSANVLLHVALDAKIMLRLNDWTIIHG